MYNYSHGTLNFGATIHHRMQNRASSEGLQSGTIVPFQHQRPELYRGVYPRYYGASQVRWCVASRLGVLLHLINIIYNHQMCRFHCVRILHSMPLLRHEAVCNFT